LRRASCNRAALRAAIALVPEGATLDVFELHDIPGFNQDDEGNPPSRPINKPEVMICSVISSPGRGNSDSGTIETVDCGPAHGPDPSRRRSPALPMGALKRDCSARRPPSRVTRCRAAPGQELSARE